ncbi:hypothetical protein [Marinomonas sp.]|uniref:hypothetical protein n=1 Tax=Marinomonas sp. TaxID=1904862 RepID=UPI003A9330E3
MLASTVEVRAKAPKSQSNNPSLALPLEDIRGGNNYVDAEQDERQERGQTTVSSGGVCFARVSSGGLSQSPEEPK